MSSMIENILNRRSIRVYKTKKVDKADIIQILTAANWAPSGNNLQPWRFSILTNNELIKKVASLTI